MDEQKSNCEENDSEPTGTFPLLIVKSNDHKDLFLVALKVKS